MTTNILFGGTQTAVASGSGLQSHPKTGSGLFGSLFTGLLGVSQEPAHDGTQIQGLGAIAGLLAQLLAAMQQQQVQSQTDTVPSSRVDNEPQVAIPENIIAALQKELAGLPDDNLLRNDTVLNQLSDMLKKMKTDVLTATERKELQSIVEKAFAMVSDAAKSDTPIAQSALASNANDDAEMQDMPFFQPQSMLQGEAQGGVTVPFHVIASDTLKSTDLLSASGMDNSVSGADGDFLRSAVTGFSDAQEPIKISHVSVTEKSGGVKEITMDLIPEKLGRVHLEMSIENNMVRAVVKCENPMTLRLFNDNIQLLENALKDHQIKIDSFQFSFDDGKRNMFKQQEEQKKKKNVFFMADDVSALSADAAVMALRTVDLRI